MHIGVNRIIYRFAENEINIEFIFKTLYIYYKITYTTLVI